MSENISLVETEQIDDKIQKILRQTDYSEVTAGEKLKEYNYDEIAVIKAYLGIAEKKGTATSDVGEPGIYRQLRHKLDSNMREYQGRVERGEAKKII